MGEQTFNDIFTYDDDPTWLQILVHVLLWLAVAILIIVLLYYMCKCACAAEEEPEEERQIIVRQYHVAPGHVVPGSPSGQSDFRMMQEYDYMDWQNKTRQRAPPQYQQYAGPPDSEHYQMAPTAGHIMPTAPPPPYTAGHAAGGYYTPGPYVAGTYHPQGANIRPPSQR